MALDWSTEEQQNETSFVEKLRRAEAAPVLMLATSNSADRDLPPLFLSPRANN